MPLLWVAPSAAASVTSTSSDGVVTAVTDPERAGVLLRVAVAGVWECRIWRTDVSSGERIAVRSGDPALVVEGVAYAYDHEARPGRTYAYSATWVGGESTAATVPLAEVAQTAWLKSARDPSLSRPVIPAPYASATMGDQSSYTPVIGAANPYVSVQAHLGRSWTLTVYSFTEVDADAVLALLDSGPLLWQPDSASSTRSWWMVAGDVQETQIGGVSGGVWIAAAQTRAVDRPVTTGEPMLMPGWSWADAVAPYSTMTEVSAAYPDMWSLLLAGLGT